MQGECKGKMTAELPILAGRTGPCAKQLIGMGRFKIPFLGKKWSTAAR